MNNSATIERIKKMIFGSVYPLYLAKVEKKGRTKEELDQVITWLTGFSQKQIDNHIKDRSSFESFFCSGYASYQCPTHYWCNLRLPNRGNRRPTY